MLTMRRTNQSSSPLLVPEVLLTLLLSLLSLCASAAIDRPEFSIYQSRVKQHRAGAAGDLVKGEEELRKIILGWHQIEGSDVYEICHQCVGRINEGTGEEVEGKEEIGMIHPISPEHTCGGQPCLIMPAAPLGQNTFHLRFKKDGNFSPWSTIRNYNVGDVGPIEHEEL